MNDKLNQTGKSNRHTFTRVTAIIFVLFLSLFDQEDTIAQLDTGRFRSLNEYAIRNSLPDEHILLITDRNIYLCGEDIYFTACLYEGNWFMPLSLNPVIYIELYDWKNNVLARTKMLLEGKKVTGKISIPRNITSQVCYLRAYTAFMKNYAPGQFYETRLKIINPFYDYNRYADQAQNIDTIICRIFPEGGRFIENISTRALCIFTDRDGRPVNTEARVIDRNNNITASVKTIKPGLGFFEVKPEQGNFYLLEFTDQNLFYNQPVNDIYTHGIVLRLNSITDKAVILEILSTDPGAFPLRLYARHGDFIYPLREILITDPGMYEIPRDRFPSGLSRIFLTDMKENILSQRMIYLKPWNKLNAVITTDKINYDKRDMVNAVVELKDDIGNPVNSEMIVQVVLTENNIINEDSDRLADALFYNELNPVFAEKTDLFCGLNPDEPSTDLLLAVFPDSLNHRFLKDENISHISEEGIDIISGNLVSLDGIPVKNMIVEQSFTGRSAWIGNTISDSLGRFHFFNESTGFDEMVIRIKDTAKNFNIIMDNEFSDRFPFHNPEHPILSKEEIIVIEKLFINIQVEDAYNSSDVGIQPGIHEDTLSFFGSSYKAYHFPDYMKLPNMKEFIYEIIEGVIVKRINNKDEIRILEKSSYKEIGDNPLLIIDGIPVSESSVIFDLPPELVRLVKVVRNKYFYLSQIYDGIIEINTLNADASDFELPKNTFRFSYTPLQKEINTIEIKIQENEKGRTPLYRNLLYLNPGIDCGENGKASFSFMTPDNSGTFKIICYIIEPGNHMAVISKYIYIK